MRVILKRPGEAAEVGDLVDYKAMDDFIGGFFETVPLLTADGSRYVIVCNDNFLNDGSKFNLSLSGVQFFGNIFICNIEVVNEIGELDFTGLSLCDILNISDCIGWSEADKSSLYSVYIRDNVYCTD